MNSDVASHYRTRDSRPSTTTPEQLLPEERMRNDRRRSDAVRLRARLVKWVRSHLDERGFLEVQTPFLHTAPECGLVHQCESDTAGGRLFLRTDPEEYLKRYLAAGFEAVYEVAANVRAEAADRHRLQEFTSVEFYRRQASFGHVLALTDGLVRGAATDLSVPGAKRSGASRLVWPRPFAVVPFAEAVSRWAELELSAHPSAEALAAEIRRRGWWGGTRTAADGFRRTWLEWLLDVRVLPQLSEPTFIVDYPTEIGLSAREDPARPGICLRGELFLPGGLELAHVYENLTEAKLLRQRYAERLAHRVARGLPEVDLDEGLLASAERGMPPMAGAAIGIDRLLMLISGAEEVGEGLLFPREGFACCPLG